MYVTTYESYESYESYGSTTKLVMWLGSSGTPEVTRSLTYFTVFLNNN